MDEENYSINNNSKIEIENNPLSEIVKSDGKGGSQIKISEKIIEIDLPQVKKEIVINNTNNNLSKDVNFKSFKNLLLSTDISFPSNSSENVGKLSVGRHNRLKSALSLFKLSLFSDFNSKLRSEFDETFLKISNNIAADVVVLPSLIVWMLLISS